MKNRNICALFVGMMILSLLACDKDKSKNEIKNTTEINTTEINTTEINTTEINTEENKPLKNSYADNTINDNYYNCNYTMPIEWHNIDSKDEGMCSYSDNINGVILIVIYSGKLNEDIDADTLEEAWKGIREESFKERSQWSEKYYTTQYGVYGIYGKGNVKLPQWEEEELSYTFIFANGNELYLAFMSVADEALWDYSEDFYRFINTIQLEKTSEIQTEDLTEKSTQLPKLINRDGFTIYDEEETTENLTQPIMEQSTENMTQDIIYQDENVIITYTGLSKHKRGYAINFLIENISGKTLTVQLRETSINGYMVDPVCSIEISPKKKAIDNALIIDDEAERFPIDNIKNIETKFHIFNSNDWNDGSGYDTESIIVFETE